MAEIKKEMVSSKWEEMKETKETLAVFNHRKASVHYLELANNISIK